jgi:maltokinase
VAELLRLDGLHAVRVVATETGHRAEAVTASGDGWTRSTAGDGAGLAVLHRLRSRSAVEEGFRVTAGSWLPTDDGSERAMGVDQTHESWIVGGTLVVKWMTEPLVGPHPAADRLRRLAAAGFAESPTLVGVIEWQEPGTGHWVPAVVVQSYLPGAEDGWTWALEAARRALGVSPGKPVDVGSTLGDIVARLHLALSDDPVRTLDADQARWQAAEARAALADTVGLLRTHDAASHALIEARRADVEVVLAVLDDAAGTPVIAVHGDLHVGQVLRDTSGHHAVVDFDGNPTVPPDLRAAPAPAASDVASMLVSLENVEHVVRRYAPEVTQEAGLTWTREQQARIVDAYRRALGDRADLYDEALVPAYEWEQVCREFLYAIRHDLLEWLYVPAAAVRRRLAPEG